MKLATTPSAGERSCSPPAGTPRPRLRQARAEGVPQPQPPCPPEPKHYTYRVKASHPHSTKAYTQGLLWHDGRLWEGTGQHGESVVQTLDLGHGPQPRAGRACRARSSARGSPSSAASSSSSPGSRTPPTSTASPTPGSRSSATTATPGEGWGLTTDGRKALHDRRLGQPLHGRPGDVPPRAAHVTVTLARRAGPLPQRAGVDRRPHLGQRLHDRPARHHRPGNGPRRGGGRPRGAAARRGAHPHDRRAERHRLGPRLETPLRHGQELEQTLRNRDHRTMIPDRNEKRHAAGAARAPHPAARRRIRHHGPGLRARTRRPTAASASARGTSSSRGATTCSR